jgi:hypothetical protein
MMLEIGAQARITVSPRRPAPGLHATRTNSAGPSANHRATRILTEAYLAPCSGLSAPCSIAGVVTLTFALLHLGDPVAACSDLPRRAGLVRARVTGLDRPR